MNLTIRISTILRLLNCDQLAQPGEVTGLQNFALMSVVGTCLEV